MNKTASAATAPAVPNTDALDQSFRTDDYEESVNSFRGILIGLVLGLIGWGVIVGGVIGAVKLLG